MAVISRVTTVRITTGVGGFREFTAIVPFQDVAEGASQIVTVTIATGGTLPPLADTLTAVVYVDDTQTTIATFALTPGVSPQTFTLYMKDTGLVGGVNIADTLRIRLRAINTTGGIGNTYDVNSDNGSYGSPASVPMTGGSATATSAGWVRGITRPVGSVSNVSFGGAKPNPFAATNSVYLRYLFASKPAVSRTNTVTFGPLSATTTSATTTFQNQFANGIGNNWPIALTIAQATGLTFANAGLTSLPYVATGVTTTPDSSSGGYTARLLGSTLPALVTSPFSGLGNAMQFDGVARGGNYQAVDAGTSVTGVPAVSGVGAAAAFTLRGRIRTSALPSAALQFLFGRIKASLPGQLSGSLHIDTSNAVIVYVRTNAGVVILLQSVTVLASNTNYELEASYDGTTLRLFINGNVDVTVAMPGVEASDGLTRFIIGGYDSPSPATDNGFVFTGIIDDVEWSKVARHTANYTPSTSPYVADANTLGLWQFNTITSPVPIANDTANVDPRATFTQLLQTDDIVFGTPPLSKNITSQRFPNSAIPEMTFRIQNAAGQYLNGVTWTEKIYDIGQITGSPTTPTSIRTAVSQNQGGEAGWSDKFISWSNPKPSGLWVHSATITAPSNLTGTEDGSNVQTVIMTARNPDYTVTAASGSSNAAGALRHFIPGDPWIGSAVLFNFQTGLPVAVDTNPAPIGYIERFNLALVRSEYLAADYSWQVLTGSAGAYKWPLTVSTGDANAYVVQVSGINTSAWTYTPQLIPILYNNGTGYTTTSSAVLTGPQSKHDSDPYGVVVGGVFDRS